MRRWSSGRRRAPTALVLAAALVLLAHALRAGGEEADSQAGAAEPPGRQVAEPQPRVGGADERTADDAVVARVIDGDTIELAGGVVVRLVQIDAPEVRGAECYAAEASAALAELIPPGTGVRVASDPALDGVDRYGRQLAYVFKDDLNLNLTLVREGAASVWFYRGGRGRYADELLAAAEEARDAGRGLWGSCQATLDPFAPVSSAPKEGAPRGAAAPAGGGCHPAYEPCLPVVPDLNCPAVRAMGKAPVRVKVPGRDPYRLDGDRDGIGCE